MKLKEVGDVAVPEGDDEVTVVGGRYHGASHPRQAAKAVGLLEVQGLRQHGRTPWVPLNASPADLRKRVATAEA